jgi:hypothetical protein
VHRVSLTGAHPVDPERAPATVVQQVVSRHGGAQLAYYLAILRPHDGEARALESLTDPGNEPTPLRLLIVANARATLDRTGPKGSSHEPSSLSPPLPTGRSTASRQRPSQPTEATRRRCGGCWTRWTRGWWPSFSPWRLGTRPTAAPRKGGADNSNTWTRASPPLGPTSSSTDCCSFRRMPSGGGPGQGGRCGRGRRGGGAPLASAAKHEIVHVLRRHVQETLSGERVPADSGGRPARSGAHPAR